MSESRFTARSLAPALVAMAAALAAGPAAADETGQMEYMYNCAACHGDSGLGDGPVARYINVPTPSLTTLSQANDGEFPMLHVIQVIDGRTGVGPHGTIMPIWGERFTAASIESAGPYGAEVIVRGRILSLAMYLESIQE